MALVNLRGSDDTELLQSQLFLNLSQCQLNSQPLVHEFIEAISDLGRAEYFEYAEKGPPLTIVGHLARLFCVRNGIWTHP